LHAINLCDVVWASIHNHWPTLSSDNHLLLGLLLGLLLWHNHLLLL
jgi:hypothetical protein